MSRRADKAFSYMKKNAEAMRFERTGLIPATTEDYVNLKNWYKRTAYEYKQKKMQQNINDLEVAKKQIRELALVFGGKTIGDCNVGILGLPTVWARNWTPTEAHPLAPWPSPREFREEGDERYTSNYGRYLPIPRLPGNSTVVYKQKSWSPIEPLDMVMPVPMLYGNINFNELGYFDATVDEAGVPYDDEELPGKEYFVEQNNHTSQINSGGHSLWSGDTKVSLEDRNATLHMSGTPTRKPRFSRFRAEAVPFVARNLKEKDSEASIDYSKVYMKDDTTEKEEAFGANIGALLESTNILLEPKAGAGAGLFGYVGMERANGVLENDPFMDSHLKKSRGNNLSATKGKKNLTDFIARKGELRSKAMLQSSSQAAFHVSSPVQSGLMFNEAQNVTTSSTYNMEHPTSLFGVAKSLGLHKATSLSSRNKAHKPAALKLHKSTNGGVKLGATTKHA